MEGDDAQHLTAPSLRASPFAAAQQRQPSAWREAFDEAQLSPMASAVIHGQGMSFTKSKQLYDGGVVDLAPGSTTWTAVRQEARNLCHLALPLSVTNLVGYCIGAVSMSFTGRLGQFELSVCVLATSIFNVTGLSLLMGFSAAMETLCGQAVGAANFSRVGTVYQRAMTLTTILAALVAALWTQADRLLVLLRQDPELSKAAARYVQVAIPALWFSGMYEVSKRYLMSQGAVRPATLVTLVGLAMSPLYNWLFIWKLGWGLDGAAVAVNAIQASMAALLGGYILIRDWSLRGTEHATWHGWSMEALRGWPTYLRFALPSVAMVCLEWWTFEALILFSGWLDNPDLSVAVMGICIMSSGIIWMFVSGFSMALSVRVSNSLGAGCPKTARLSTWTAASLGVSIELASMAAVHLCRHQWARLFTDAQPVIDLTASLLPIFALTLPGDGANIVLQGLLRGSGRQETGAITNLCSYWCLGLPLAAFLAFKRHMGLYGLWWAIVVTNCVQGTNMAIIALRFDYQVEAVKAVARSRHTLAEAAGSSRDSDSLAAALLGGQRCSDGLEQGLSRQEPEGSRGITPAEPSHSLREPPSR